MNDIEDIPVNPQEIIRIRNLGTGYDSVNISSRMLSLLCDGVEMLWRANERLRENYPASDRLAPIEARGAVTDAEVLHAESLFNESAPRYTAAHDCHPHDMGEALRNSVPSEERIREVLEAFLRTRESAPAVETPPNSA